MDNLVVYSNILIKKTPDLIIHFSVFENRTSSESQIGLNSNPNMRPKTGLAMLAADGGGRKIARWAGAGMNYLGYQIP
jgi:hypothetical protein